MVPQFSEAGTQSASTPRRLSGCWHALLLLAAVLPYFVNLNVSSLWDSNEAFYAETPREMLENGDYVIPRFNYFFRWQKPPLAYWGVALSYCVFGVSEWSARIPIALAAAAWVLLCYWLGCIWINRGVGLGAALILSTNFRVFAMARRAITEIWLAFWISLAMALFAYVLAQRPRGSKILLAAAYTALGAAIMTKGPVALALAGGTILLFALWRRSWQDLLLLKPWLGLLILSAILLPWYWNVASITGWQPLKTFFWSDNLSRYLSEDFGPQRGPWYFPAILVMDFSPWSVLGVAGMATMWKALAPRIQAQKFLGGWLVLWVVWGTAFFSISRNKQEYYILPLYMPVALLLAYLFHMQVLSNSWKRARQAILCTAAAMTAAAGVFIALPARILLPGIPMVAAVASGMFLGALAAGLFCAAMAHRWRLSLALIFLALWSVILTTAWLVLPEWEYYKPVRQFAEIIKAQRKPGDYCGYYRYSAPSLAFYLREPIFEIIWENQIIHLLSKASGRVFCIITQEDYKAIQPHLAQSYRIIASRPLMGFRARDLARMRIPQQHPQLLLISNAP